MSNIERSPWIIHFDGAGCSGCNVEAQACFTPLHDAERYGIKKTNNPRFADVLLITGIVDEKNRDEIEYIYQQMSEPKTVVAVGACACSGGMFRDCETVVGNVDSVIPVDVYIPGCPARPEAVIEGIMKSLDRFEDEDGNKKEKPEKVKKERTGKEKKDRKEKKEKKPGKEKMSRREKKALKKAEKEGRSESDE